MNTPGKRQLSPEERDMAARIKAIIAARPDLTEQRVGEMLGGLSQGAISHWTGARGAVPAKHAATLAAILGIDDPGEISMAFRALSPRSAVAEAPAVYRTGMTIDPEIVRDVARALHKVYSESGRSYSLEDEPERFAMLYEVAAAAGDGAAPDNMVRLMIKQDAKIGVSNKDGESTRVPTGGTTQKRHGHGLTKG